MRLPLLVVVCAAEACLPAASLQQFTQHRIDICLEGDGDRAVAAQAEGLTSEMFAKIGIHLEWHHDARHCKNPAEDYLVVTLSTNTPGDHSPGALAFSRLREGVHIEVFYDRVARTAETHGVHKLLAHVLAHEIGHMLEGTGGHSESGIMKAHWDAPDLLALSDQPLSFTKADEDLIRRGMSRREMKLAGTLPPLVSTP